MVSPDPVPGTQLRMVSPEPPKEALPALDRMREDPNAEVRKQAQAASDRIESKAESSQDNSNARKTASR